MISIGALRVKRVVVKRELTAGIHNRTTVLVQQFLTEIFTTN